MNEVQDPYRAPASPMSAEGIAPDPVTLPLASRGRRFCTYLVDYVGVVFVGLVGMVAAVILRPEFAANLESMGNLEAWGIGLVATFLYYNFFEGLFSRTPGKWICGTRVVDDKGLPPTMAQVFGRTFARMVPFEAFSVLFASDDDVRGWHDRWPKTRVVLVR